MGGGPQAWNERSWNTRHARLRHPLYLVIEIVHSRRAATGLEVAMSLRMASRSLSARCDITRRRDRILLLLRHLENVGRHLFRTAKFHDASRFDIIETLLNEASQPHQFAFRTPEQARPQ